MVFIDASSNMEEHNMKVFILCTHSVAGALPLGLIICSDERTKTLTRAFQMYRDSLPERAFYGNGKRGPSVFMTDNCPEERDALKSTWPMATLILCIFHILQQVWRWLHESKHAIKMEERPDLLLKFKQLVYAETKEEWEKLYRSALRSRGVKKYPLFVNYLKTLKDIKESWAVCFRSKLFIRGNNTNNNAEAQFLIIKDIILQRVREFNVVSLFDKLVTDFNEYYKNKLLSIASSSFDGNYRNRFVGKKKEKCGTGYRKPSEDEMKYMTENLIDHGHGLYSVPSSSQDGTSYLVDMDAGTCICPVGSNGAPCKHQYVIWISTKGTGPNFLPIFSPEERKKYAEIAIGASLTLESYAGLHNYNSTPTSTTVADTPEVSNSDVQDVENGSPPVDHGLNNELPSDTSKHEGELAAATTALADFSEFILKKLPHVDSSYLNGLIKFTKKVKTMTNSRASSAFHLFGSKVHRHSRIVNSVRSANKRAQKGNIQAQPGAVERRKKKNGSRTYARKGKSTKPLSSNIPMPSVGSKRKHAFSLNVLNNNPVPKKAGRSMGSKTKIGRPVAQIAKPEK